MRLQGALLVLAALSAACDGSSPPAKRTSSASSPARANTPVTPDAGPLPTRDSGPIPSDFRDLWKQAATGEQRADHDGLTYWYAVGKTRAAAVMIPRPIPRNDSVMVGVVSDFALHAFNADLTKASPRIEPTQYGGNAIAFAVGSSVYRVLLIKNETQEGAYGPGEPHTLLMWRDRN